MSESKYIESAKIPAIVLFAPTASGKTALTRELFSPQGSHFILNAEVVSADSQAVYRNMNIGTAKPTKEFCKEIPHHLIDILEPDQQFNVSDFVDAADEICKKIIQKDKIPVVCGGTGFYIRNFLYGVPQTPISDEKIRNKLKKRIFIEGNEALYRELQQIDPESALKIHKNDSYRICRALEVYYLCGKTRTSFQLEHKLREMYDFLFIVLEPEREELYQKIAVRVEKMFELGLEKEIRNLIDSGYSKESPGLKAIGYREWFDYENPFDKNNIPKIKEQIIHHSCKYAKKQYTYIRDIKGSNIIKYNGSEENFSQVISLIQDWKKNKKRNYSM